MGLLKASLEALNRNDASGNTTKLATLLSKMYCSILVVIYNSHRLHSYLEYKSPNQYEAETAEIRKVA